MSAQSANVRINSCRICLEPKFTDGVSFDDGDNWLKMYEFCFGLNISPEDTPRNLCGTCVKKMENFSKLKYQSIQSDKLWRNIISVNPKIITDKYIKEESYDFDFDTSSISYEYTERNGYVKEEKQSLDIELKENLLQEIDKKINEDSDKEYPVKSFKEYLNEKPSYLCKCCKILFRYKKSYKRHLLKNNCRFRHNTVIKLPKQCFKMPREFYCGLCDFKSSNDTEVDEHLNIHSANNDLTCKLCDYTGRDFADMETHRYTHQENPLYKCHNCANKYKHALALQYHYRSVHLNKSGGMCSVCNKVYNSYNSWKNHERWHIGARYICDHCGKRYLHKSDIIYHLKDHGVYHGYVCDVCGRKFKRMSNLKLHMEQVHDYKKVTCTHCDKTFKNEKNLKLHLIKQAKEKKYQCEVCSKCYSTVGALNKHMIWHSDDRPYACDMCGSSYKVKSQLTIHKRTHTGDLPYKCTVANCSKAFACSNQLKVHLNVHSGVRRYKCPYCEKTFHNKCNVVMHCAKRHNVTDVVVVSSKKEIRKAESS